MDWAAGKYRKTLTYKHLEEPITWDEWQQQFAMWLEKLLDTTQNRWDNK